jgi:signal transduction histidine kinase
MTEGFKQVNGVAEVDWLFITDKDDVVKYSVGRLGQGGFANVDLSSRDYVQDTKRTFGPVFSDGFKSIDGVFRIAVTYPIINRDTNQYIGLVGAQIPTVDFFRRYGNIYNIESQYLAVLDNHSVQLAHPVESFIGTPFFGNHTQEATGYNTVLNNLVRTVMTGKPSSAIYEFMNNERLNTGNPIFLQNIPKYFNFIITPTNEIYAQVNDVLFAERLKTLSLLIGASAAILVLVISLLKWNSSLNSQVKRRTKELEESNRQLKQQGEMQKDFINTAAHELRTPIQPILGLSDLLIQKATDPQQRKLLNVITRNAKRLQRLAEDILDVSRIESQNLRLRKERLNLNELIGNLVREFQEKIGKEYDGYDDSEKIGISFEHSQDVILISVDKARIGQVISNLLDNSLKFTKLRRDVGGERKMVSIFSTIEDGWVEVIVKDMGTGIDPEMESRLFTRFASKSFSGTGLGLYLCKKIIESHGGSILGKNNPDGIGAIFSFILPLDS